MCSFILDSVNVYNRNNNKKVSLKSKAEYLFLSEGWWIQLFLFCVLYFIHSFVNVPELYMGFTKFPDVTQVTANFAGECC